MVSGLKKQIIKNKKKEEKKASREYSRSVKVYGLGVANNVQELHFILKGEGADAVLVLEKKNPKQTE